MNISLMWALTSVEYINMLHSKLCSKLRKSKLVEPTVQNSSSTTSVLLWSIPAS